MEYNDFIDIEGYKIPAAILQILLMDRTTGHNIIWATDIFKKFAVEKYQSGGFSFYDQIELSKIVEENKLTIKPRASKSLEEQSYRSEEKGEVFTAAWLCNKQNNTIDDNWFGHAGSFNMETPNGWNTNNDKILFPDAPGKTWQDYIKDFRIEICCGEAPYLVSRFDVTNMKPIPFTDRIGLLDRKLRVINENTIDLKKESWLSWVQKAYASTYGFEWQGDNLILARIGLLLTFIDDHRHRWGTEPNPFALGKIATIISWNIWQMDGLSFGIPGFKPREKENQTEKEQYPQLFDLKNADKPISAEERYCRIMEWTYFKPLKGNEIIFKSLTTE